MIAETAFNVIQALPEKEYRRLMQMLGVEEKPKQVRSAYSGTTKAERVEYLIRKCANNKKRR